jgi:CheY-like chemotaxis protein
MISPRIVGGTARNAVDVPVRRRTLEPDILPVSAPSRARCKRELRCPQTAARTSNARGRESAPHIAGRYPPATRSRTSGALAETDHRVLTRSPQRPNLKQVPMTKSRQVLVVEDDPDILYIASKKLRAAGFDVLEAANGIEAIQRMIDNPNCRLMLADFVMPSFGGTYWVRFLERFCADWNIVVVSSEDVDPGPFVSVPKPVDYENLLHVFRREMSHER